MLGRRGFFASLIGVSAATTFPIKVKEDIPKVENPPLDSISMELVIKSLEERIRKKVYFLNWKEENPPGEIQANVPHS